jgi:GT2 family glycosyltransferase
LNKLGFSTISKDTLQKNFDFIEQHLDCGVLGCRLIIRDGTMQPSARYFPTPWNMFLSKIGIVNNKIPFLRGVDDMEQDHTRVFECDWVPGCYLLTRKKIIDDLGFFLRKDFFMYLDDVDLCLRIKKKGWKVYFYPNDVIHLGGANSAKLTEVTEEGKQTEKYHLESEFLYFRKNYNIFYVLADFFLIVVVAILRTAKRILLFKKKDLSTIWKSVSLSYHILIATRFGKVPIH